MRFAIIGAGGVGGFFGGKLAKNGVPVWFVARGNHLAAMKSAGLRINSTEGNYVVPPGQMTDNLLDIGTADVILFCVKSYDTESAASQLRPILTSASIIISLQNGLDNEEKIQRVIDTDTVYGGVAYIYSTITAPGVITETGGPKKIVFGALNGKNSEAAGSIVRVLTEAGIRAELTDDIRSTLWEKFIFIASVGGLTAMTRLTLGEILAVRETRALLVDAMNEVLALAKAKGAFVEEGYVETTFEKLKKFDTNTRSSLYHDLTHHKPMEIEALSGTVVRYGVELGIPTPIHKTIHAALLPYHLNHLQLKKH